MLFGIRMIPYGTRYITEAFQSLNKVFIFLFLNFFFKFKINSLLLIEQYDTEIYPPKAENIAIQLKDCTFTWDSAVITDDDKKQKKTKNAELKSFLFLFNRFIENLEIKTTKKDVSLNGNLPMMDDDKHEGEEDDALTIAVHPLKEDEVIIEQKEMSQPQFCLKIDNLCIQKVFIFKIF
jgi:hypothetical protein